jgi:uncharacterized protein (DUF2252 family)
MTVTADRAAAGRSGRSGARASGRSPARAAAAEHLSRADRAARGKDARAVAPLEAQAEFRPDRSRDPVGLLLGQAQSRVPELVPVRHGRMLVSAFTFYRGAALPMAADLSATPASGLRVQLCGDAHLSNFGAFASPERRLVFDINDFDETLPGPFEWDVKRLAASLAVAGRDNGYPAKARRKIALAAAEGYRTAMRGFAQQPFLDVWYAHLDIEPALAEFRSEIKAKGFKAAQAQLAKAHTRDSTQALRKLTTMTGGQRRIISDPPMIVAVEEIFPDVQAEAIYEQLRAVLGKYRRTLQSDRRHLLEQFTLVQMARKVVGVGSVGTRAWVLLMDAADGVEPLFLQAKEAQPSVLAGYCGRSRYSNQGERVVAGQHLMQAQSDIFLGWTRVTNPDDGMDRDFYVRQLRDWKFSVPIEQMVPAGMTVYARLCGWTLARAHARSGDRIALAAYLGNSAKFDQAIADFAETYADQNERDYTALQNAVKDGKAEATTEI